MAWALIFEVSSNPNRSGILCCSEFMTCPLVLQIEPLRGPLEGGTLLTIRGRNLGRRFSDVVGAVRVGTVPCAPLPHRYVVSET